jgi:hypothetical protein
VPEQATAVTLASFRSLVRAPEAKLMLMAPLMLLGAFVVIFVTASRDMPDFVRPLMPFGAMAMLLITSVQLVGNQFGFDRGGFRVYVLSPVPRRDVLLGKNLAFALVAACLAVPILVLVQVLFPVRIDRFLASLPQGVSMFLLFCLVANCLSILTPMPVAAGSFKPTNVQLVPVLLQMAIFFLFPLLLAPTLVPLGIELALEALGWVEGVPIYLMLALLVCAGVVWLYWLALGWQGRLLLAREQHILEVVAGRSE